MKLTVQSSCSFLLVSALLLTLSNTAQSQAIASAGSFPKTAPYQAPSEDLATVLSELAARFGTEFNYDNATVYRQRVSRKLLQNLEKHNNLERTLEDLLLPIGLNFERFEDASYAIYPQSKIQGIRKIQHKPSEDFFDASKKRHHIQRPFSPSASQAIINKQAQTLDKTITGKVTGGDTNEPLPGVNILAKSTTVGTVTDLDGNYRLTIADEVTTLVFSSIGYEAQEVPINGRTVIDMVLMPDIQSLSEGSSGRLRYTREVRPDRLGGASRHRVVPGVA